MPASLSIWLQFAACFAAIGFAGARLVRYGDAIAALTGLSRGWIGLILVATVTSLPELATTLGALRIGAIDLAFGNLLGSNLFDLLIVAIDDLAYLGGPIYARVAPVHAVSALVAGMMSGAVIVALVYRPTQRVLRTMNWASISLVALYLANAFLQYRHGR